MKRHMLSAHSDRAKTGCSVCSKGYTDGAELRAHEKLHGRAGAEGLSLSCLFCPSPFTNSRDLRAHVASEHEVPKCTYCARVFSSDKKLEKHLTTVHVQAPSLEPTFKCTLCPHVSKYRSAFAQHMNWHSSTRQHVCEECGKTYKSSYCLKHHLRTHSGESPYKCSSCPKTFTSSSKLRNHVETHNEAKAYVCEKCGKSFRARKNLGQHVARHRDRPTTDKDKGPPRKRVRTKKSLKAKVKGETEAPAPLEMVYDGPDPDARLQGGLEDPVSVTGVQDTSPGPMMTYSLGPQTPHCPWTETEETRQFLPRPNLSPTQSQSEAMPPLTNSYFPPIL